MNTKKLLKDIELDDYVVVDTSESGSVVSVEQLRKQGEQIAIITVDDKPTVIYAAEQGGSSGSIVSVEETLTSGTKIANIRIDGQSNYVYSPTVDLTEYAKKSELPAKTSQLENDSGFLTLHQSLDEYAKKTELPAKTSQLENDSGFLTLHQSLAEYAKKTDILKYASEIVLKEDLEFKGNYTLGNVKTTTAATYTARAGTSIEQMLRDIFSGEMPDALPTIDPSPSVSITLTNLPSGNRIKVGTSFTPGYSIKFNPGLYKATLGSDTKTLATNVAVSKYEITLNGTTTTVTSTSQEITGSFDQITPSTVGTLSLNASVVVTHGAGDIAKTYNGKDSYPIVKVEAETKDNTTKLNITVYDDVVKYNYIVKTIRDSESELDGITAENVATNINTKQTYTYDEVNDVKVVDKQTGADCVGLAVYTKHSLNVQTVKANNGALNILKSTAHSLGDEYDCFLKINTMQGLNMPANSKIVIS